MRGFHRKISARNSARRVRPYQSGSLTSPFRSCRRSRQSNGRSASQRIRSYRTVYRRSTASTTARLYVGLRNNKRLRGVVVFDVKAKHADYAFSDDGGKVEANASLSEKLGEGFDRSVLDDIRRTQTFFVSRGDAKLPTVSEAGFKTCLTSWRRGTRSYCRERQIFALINIGGIEYFFHVMPWNDENIYCGFVESLPNELGYYSGRQQYRIRNFGDNSADFYGAFSKLNNELPPDLPGFENGIDLSGQERWLHRIREALHRRQDHRYKLQRRADVFPLRPGYDRIFRRVSTAKRRPFPYDREVMKGSKQNREAMVGNCNFRGFVSAFFRLGGELTIDRSFMGAPYQERRAARNRGSLQHSRLGNLQNPYNKSSAGFILWDERQGEKLTQLEFLSFVREMSPCTKSVWVSLI